MPQDLKVWKLPLQPAAFLECRGGRKILVVMEKPKDKVITQKEMILNQSLRCHNGKERFLLAVGGPQELPGVLLTVMFSLLNEFYIHRILITPVILKFSPIIMAM